MRFLITALLLLPFTVVHANLSYEQLKSLTDSPDVLSGTFTQGKYLKALDASITSSGFFEYQKLNSIRWVTQKPVHNELIMTNSSIINKQGDQELVKIDLNNSGQAKLLHELLFSVLTAEWDRLSLLFSVDGRVSEGQWVAVLKPEDELVKKIMTSIELRGDHRVRWIVISEKSGDKTTISFTYPDKQ